MSERTTWREKSQYWSVCHHYFDSPATVDSNNVTDLGFETQGKHRIEIRTPVPSNIDLPLRRNPGVPFLPTEGTVAQQGYVSQDRTNQPASELMFDQVIDLDAMDLELSIPRLDSENITFGFSGFDTSRGPVEANVHNGGSSQIDFEFNPALGNGGILSNASPLSLPYRGLPLTFEADVVCALSQHSGSHIAWPRMGFSHLSYSPGNQPSLIIMFFGLTGDRCVCVRSGNQRQ
jgi:hypothetical protein